MTKPEDNNSDQLEEVESEADVDGAEEDDNDIPDNGDNDNCEELDNMKESLEKEPRKVHKLSLKKTEDFNEKLRKRGVIYVSRVPPKMNPTKMKSLLSGFGEVTRIYLVEEDATVRKRRRKLSGNGSKRYVEGWVEYSDKKVAKRVALSLNTTSMSNYKRNPHYGELWNLKYLPKFQWSHLTEKVAYERRVREQKLRLETMQAKRETAAYKRLVETGNKLDKIEERKRKREEKEGKTKPSTKPKDRPYIKQLKPMEEGGSKPTKRALLGGIL